ncbi:MAG: TIGR03032 family protein [Flavobacteriales bacterium CG18_big_fil_WC_8_21_14_2_50_32_9]|nr:MAG: TIGR03032 family protein [Flavobacteriales bacterium CG18_big_fil_WC_8_21_14_2_50_32_9]
MSPHPDNEHLTTLPRTFQKPMGIAIKDDRMAISLKDEVIVFQNSRELATFYPNKQNTYDSLWLPRTTYYTGLVDLHDIDFGDDGIYAINTSFSCICKIDGEFNFTPVWKPPFINEIIPGDLCHLNGMVVLNGKPKYVTALGTTNTPQGWKENIVHGGVLMDVEKNEIVLNGLSMPHSPKIYNNELYLLMSASGEFIKVNLETKSYQTLKKFEGFCRGLSFYKDFAFIGFSKLRKNSSTFAKLSFSDKANFSGIKIIHMPTNAEVGEIIYETSVDEIYEVIVLENMIRPNILNTIDDVHKLSLATPSTTYWAKKEEQE